MPKDGVAVDEDTTFKQKHQKKLVFSSVFEIMTLGIASVPFMLMSTNVWLVQASCPDVSAAVRTGYVLTALLACA